MRRLCSTRDVSRWIASITLLLAASASAGSIAPPAQSGRNAYTVITAGGRRALPVRASAGRETVALDQLATMFALSVSEDQSLGLTIRARNQSILLIPGQAFAQVAGRVVRLSAPVERDRSTWQVPIDFLTAALGPALGLRMDVRRDSRLIVVGDVRVPRITGRLERRGPAARLVLDLDPPVPHRVTRDGQSLLVRFEAELLDLGPVTDLAREFVTNVRVDGTTLRIDLGPTPVSFEATDNREQTRLTLDLLPPPPVPVTPRPTPGAPPGSAQAGTAPQEPPAPVDIIRPGTVRTIVLDPGHGGDDEGARSSKGVKEKDITFQIALRVKAAIETRWGLRVLLTRDRDERVAIDRRTSFANNNKADLFISLHANSALRPSVRGAQVLTLSLAEYRDRAQQLVTKAPPVPVYGGGLRTIEPVPWDIAQLPFSEKSAQLGAILVRHLAERKVPLRSTSAVQAPLRVLVGANMPAVLLELGFLSNADDELALAGAELPGTLVEAILASIAEVRFGFPAGTAPAPDQR